MGIPKAHHHRHHHHLNFSTSYIHPSLLSLSDLFFSLLFLFSSIPAQVAAGNLFNLVYKGCANQTFSDDAAATSGQTLAALASALSAQAAQASFYKSTASSPNDGHTLSGLYQCRGDLSRSDCSACVEELLPMWSSLCGIAVAARVQLVGCYALYQVSGFPQVSGIQMLYKYCASDGGGGSFETKRDTAFSQLQSGITAGQGFYATSYASVYAIAQCEGDLSASDCNECVSYAIQRSEAECGDAAGGQAYLDKCYVSYSYHSSGVFHGSGSSPASQTVAIVLGGAAVVGFLVVCLMFARSLLKERDADY